MSDLLVRRATPDDIPVIVQWRLTRAQWLNRIGSDQWSDAGLTTDQFADRVRESVQLGTTWILQRESQGPIGTIAVDDQADDGLWTDAELTDAYVIHRMIVPIDAAGQGVGMLLLTHAEETALRAGRRRLLLDAWDTNRQLHRYYEARGFEFVRAVPGHSTPSATLFSKRLTDHS